MGYAIYTTDCDGFHMSYLPIYDTYVEAELASSVFHDDSEVTRIDIVEVTR
jgi:hypothetical protein